MDSTTGSATSAQQGRETAAAGEIPAILLDPPWERAARRPEPARRKEPSPRVVDGLEPPSGLAIAWAPGQREDWSADRTKTRRWVFGGSDDHWDRMIDRYLEKGNSMWPPSVAEALVYGSEERARPLLPQWRPTQVTPNLDTLLKAIVARYEMEARDAVLHCARLEAPYAGAALLPFLDAEVAVLMADWMFRLKTAQAFTRAYFTQHGVAVVPFLVPDAVGTRRPPRRKATAALALVAEEHGEDAMLKAAAEAHGDEAADIIAEALRAGAPVPDARKKPAERPPKEPKLPWLDVEALPRPVLRASGRVLPLSATRTLVSLMALSDTEPYEGLTEVFELCEPGSLADLSWAIFEAWRAANEPPRSGWVMAQLGRLGDDETVRRLAPVIRAWPARNGHAKAVRGLEVLAAIGTDVALIHLDGIARKVRFAGLRRAAQRAITEVAEARGLTPVRLTDRLVPDFGLDADGGLTLDYGPRRFRVSFDEQLRPQVVDDSGRLRKTLPKPGVKDDPELAPAAHKRFSALKKDVRTVASDQILRLELAMVWERHWTVEEFRAFFAGHPLVWHIARRLVWLADDRAFRIAEDRTFADVEDAAFTLPENARIRIAHPLHLGEEGVAAWSEVFADYEIGQPFPQLARPVYRLTDEERDATRLARFEGATVPTRALVGLARFGWERSTPGDGGVEPMIMLRLSTDRWIVIDLFPGIHAGGIDAVPEQTLREIRLVANNPHKYWVPDAHRKFGELSPVTASEVLAMLANLTKG